MEEFSKRHKDRHTEVGTDIPCIWNKPRKVSQPLTINSIDIRSCPTDTLPIEPNTMQYNPSTQSTFSTTEIEKRIYNICKGNDSVFLHILSNSSDDESEELIPLTMQQLAEKAKCGDKNNKETSVELIKSYHNSSIIANTEERTREQADNSEWFKYRTGRITASLFSSVNHFKFGDNLENYITKKIYNTDGITFKTKAMEFGTTHEPIARQMYFRKYKAEHKNAHLSTCGLFVSKKTPYIGASPDGVVSCKCCGKGIIEIKCSDLYKDKTPYEACLLSQNKYHLCLDENQLVHLKTDSPWYVQIQGQMGVCEVNWCDFIFYTLKSFICERIYFDKEFFDDIVQKCDRFFEKYMSVD